MHFTKNRVQRYCFFLNYANFFVKKMLIEEKVVLLHCKIEEYLLFLNLFCPFES